MYPEPAGNPSRARTWACASLLGHQFGDAIEQLPLGRGLEARDGRVLGELADDER